MTLLADFSIAPGSAAIDLQQVDTSQETVTFGTVRVTENLGHPPPIEEQSGWGGQIVLYSSPLWVPMAPVVLNVQNTNGTDQQITVQGFPTVKDWYHNTNAGALVVYEVQAGRALSFTVDLPDRVVHISVPNGVTGTCSTSQDPDHAPSRCIQNIEDDLVVDLP